MAQKWSRLGLTLGGAYTALVLLATGLMIYSILVHPGTSELSGVPLILLTQPWCMILFQVLNLLKFNDRWWPVSTALLLGCAVLNALIFYAIGQALSQEVIIVKGKAASKAGLAAVGIYIAALLVAMVKMAMAISGRTNPGFSVYILMAASEPWNFLLSISVKILGGTGIKWFYFFPMSAGMVINGFVVYALSSSLFRTKVNAPNPKNV